MLQDAVEAKIKEVAQNSPYRVTNLFLDTT